MRNPLKRLREAFTQQGSAGYAYPNSKFVGETPSIPLADVMKLYERDAFCKGNIDMLAGITCGDGFYTTVNPDYSKAEKAKDAVDSFCAKVNLDRLLSDMAKTLIACGNAFWLKLTNENLHDFCIIPVGDIEKIEQSFLASEVKIPYRIEGYKLAQSRGAAILKPESVIHWRINCLNGFGFGVGMLQVLLHSLKISGSNTRPSLASWKADVERLIPKIFTKYAGPDVVVQLEGQKEETIKKLETAIRNRPEEGAWIFSGAKTASVSPVQIDPRARFEAYIEYLKSELFIGVENPLGRLFQSPGYTEASATVVKDMLEGMTISQIQRYIKRQAEREIFDHVLAQNNLDFQQAQVRLNWGNPETPEILVADLLKAAEQSLIRPEEFRKNAVKFGWELWETETSQTRQADGEEVKA